MICNCGGSSEYTHKVVRKKESQGEYQKCPSCGRILWLWKSDTLKNELNKDRELSRAGKNEEDILIF